MAAHFRFKLIAWVLSLFLLRLFTFGSLIVKDLLNAVRYGSLIVDR